MAIHQKFLIWLSKSLLNKLNKAYRRKFNSDLPIILITGTAGKSSLTLLLRNMFENSGWTVYSGATNQYCLNSIIGIPMVLANFMVRFEGEGYKIGRKLTYLYKAFEVLWLATYKKVNQNTIMIYECGADTQDELDQFKEVFQHFDLLICTAVTHEHSAGYQDRIDSGKFNHLSKFLPTFWKSTLKNNKNLGKLRNIALEQFSLLTNAERYILPKNLGQIDNQAISNFKGITSHLTRAQRTKDFALMADGQYVFNSDYLLPQTFAKNAYILKLVAQKYNLDSEIIQTTLSNITLPAGRFSLFPGILNSTIVDSTYNSDPASLNGFLDLVEEVIEASKLDTSTPMPPKHYLVFGEMRELGDTATELHQQILDRIIKLGQKYHGFFENIMLLGQEWLKCDETNVRKTEDGMFYISYNKQLFKVFQTARQIKDILNEQTIRPNAWFWIKGSQNTIFLEIVVEHLLEDKKDTHKLCRRGFDWDLLRQNYT